MLEQNAKLIVILEWNVMEKSFKIGGKKFLKYDEFSENGFFPLQNLNNFLTCKRKKEPAYLLNCVIC